MEGVEFVGFEVRHIWFDDEGRIRSWFLGGTVWGDVEERNRPWYLYLEDGSEVRDGNQLVES